MKQHFSDVDSIIDRMQSMIRETLSSLIPGGTRCALLDFPHHNNVGDNAIWLGERAFLRRIGAEVVYTCDLSTYSRHRLASRIEDGIILLHGGGNLGDVWKEHQEFREHIIESFPRNKIVQFPQTIFFQDHEAWKQAARVFSRHPDLFVLGRDQASTTLAQQLGADGRLCADMAFELGRLRRPDTPVTDVLWLARTDVESAADMRPSQDVDVQVHDWLAPPADERLARRVAAARVRLRERVSQDLGAGRGYARAVSPLLTRSFDLMASRRLARGCRLLSRGRVVVTDRLHGHILSLLLGIPHVVLDNSYGKMRRFVESFTGECELTHVAHDTQDALELARKLLDGSRAH